MRTIVNTAIFLILAVLVQGCDVTDVIKRTEPSTSVSQRTALTTEDGVDAIRAKMYDRFHSNDLSTDWMLGPAALADNTFYRSSQGRHQELNLNEIRAGIGTAARANVFDGINDANLLINGIQEGVVSDAKATRVKAEARFVRALLMHHLVRIFGYDPMNPQGDLVQPNTGPGADFNKGIIISTKPTLGTQNATPKARSTVGEVYDQIISDLEKSISLFQSLPSGAKRNSPFVATEVAAHALKARVELYQRNYQAANNQAQMALDQAASRFESGLAQPGNLDAIFNETSDNPEAIFTIDTNPTTETAGVNLALAAYTSQEWMAQIPTQELISLYSSNDARLKAWYGPCFDEIVGTKPPGCKNINKKGLELQKYEAEQGNYADDYIHFRVAEMKLIQAEARLQGNLGNAAAPLNELRNARGLSDLSGSVTMQKILNARRRELVAEGHRFFDLKRLGRDISKSAGKLSSPPQDAVPFSSFKILDDINPSQVENNSKLTQNPGYR